MTKKNITTKIIALIALLAIILSVIGTGILIIYEIYFTQTNSKKSINQSQFKELLDNYSSGINLEEKNSINLENNNNNNNN